MSEKPDVSESFIEKLYEMSEGDLKTFDRYEVGQQLGLDKEQTDAVVEEFCCGGGYFVSADSGGDYEFVEAARAVPVAAHILAFCTCDVLEISVWCC